MTSGDNSGTQLSGWKEIADYLRVSVRTAQTMEKEQGLPIRRGAGQKAPVFAIAAELDEWRLRRAEPQAAPDASLVVPVPAAASSRRDWLRYGILTAPVGAVALGLAAAGYKLRLNGRNTPASCQVNGSALVVYGQDGSEVWRHSFGAGPGGGVCRLADLDGSGHRSVLSTWSDGSPFSGSKVVAFDSNGGLRWRFSPDHGVTDILGRQFLPPFWTGHVTLFRPRGAKRDHIAVSSQHSYSFPNQVAILDGQTGKVVSEYWHRGHLNFLGTVDLDGDGQPEILAAGVNDAPEYKQATLLVLDPRKLSGATPHPKGGSYFRGIPPVPAKRTVFFPRTAVSQTLEFNRAWAIGIQPERLIIQVVESIALDSPDTVIYEFDYGFRLRNVALSDALQNHLIALQDRGEAPKEPVAVIAERLKREVVVL